MRRLAVALALGMLPMAACAVSTPPRTFSGGVLEARFIEAHRAPAVLETTTTAYRALADRTLGTRCRMFPSDSQLYDARARLCGAVPAATLGVARMLLEVAASAEFLAPVIIEERIRWLDQPAPETCRP